MKCESATGGLSALVTAANQVRAVKREPDLACYETLPAPAPAPAVAPVSIWVGNDPQWDALRIDTFYWEKHKLLRTMLSDFVGLMVRKFDQYNAERPPDKRKDIPICRLYHMKREDMPPGTLKTFEDMEELDKHIADMAKMHTRVVREITNRKRKRLEEMQTQVRAEAKKGEA